MGSREGAAAARWLALLLTCATAGSAAAVLLGGGEAPRCPAIFEGPGCRTARAGLPPCINGAFRGPLTISQAALKRLQARTLPRRRSFLGRRVPVREISDSNMPAKGPFDATKPSCALVGSDSSLTGGRARGRDIDRHRVVMRINGAPSKTYESFVGRRTTHRFTHSGYFGFREGREILVGKWEGSGDKLQTMLRRRIHPSNPEFLDYSQSPFFLRGNHLVTQGMRALLLLLHSCESVHVYGFETQRINDWYYEKSSWHWHARKRGGGGRQRPGAASPLWYGGSSRGGGEGGRAEAAGAEGPVEEVSVAGTRMQWRRKRRPTSGWAGKGGQRAGRRKLLAELTGPGGHRIDLERQCFDALHEAQIINWHRRVG